MKSARLNRLFNPKSNHCFDVAIDHGFFNEHDFLAGIEDMRKAIDVLVAAGPDAIQLTVGLAPLLQELPGRFKPSLVLRTDVANVYGKDLPRTLFSRMIHSPVEQALRLDAVCVVVNLFRIPNQPEVTDQCIQNILQLKPECDRYGMPLMIEPLVFQPNKPAGGYMVDGDLRKILPLVRQAVELLQRTEALIRQGVAGIVYGRNVIQHSNPAGMTKALMAIVHDGADASSAAKFLKPESL